MILFNIYTKATNVNDGEYLFIPLIPKSYGDISPMVRQGKDKIFLHSHDEKAMGVAEMTEHEHFYSAKLFVNTNVERGKDFMSDVKHHENTFFELKFLQKNKLAAIKHLPFTTKVNFDWND